MAWNPWWRFGSDCNASAVSLAGAFDYLVLGVVLELPYGSQPEHVMVFEVMVLL